jgi:hypothetical protein
MSFLIQVLEFVLLSIVAVDTLGFIAELRKNSSRADRGDYIRLCFTWVFFLVLSSLCCATCSSSYFSGFFKMLLLIAKVYITLPSVRGTETLYSLLVEQNVMKTYLLQAYDMVKAKTQCSEEH